MTQSEIEELLRLAEKATPGDWQQNGSHIYGPDPQRLLVCQIHYIGRGYQEESAANEALIKRARTELPRLARFAKDAMEWLEDTVRLAEHCDGVARLGIKLDKPKEMIAAYHATPQASASSEGGSE